MSFDLDALRGAVQRHGTVGRIVIADHAGSAPRETGTSMLVFADGQDGTIGGGALEYGAVRRLRVRLAQGGTQIDRLPLGPALGQCCGGAVTLVSEVFDAAGLAQLPTDDGLYARSCAPDMPEPLSITRLRAQGRNGSGAHALVFDGSWLAEPLATRKTALWIYGAGHVGRAIVAALAPLPALDITWVDTGSDRFPNTRPDQVTLLPATNPAGCVRLAPPDAYHLILTYSHALDLELCHQVLTHRFAFAGLIGSATKWARFRSRLGDLGHSTEAISRITCPIGDPALGKHPQEIALGVASALLASLRGKDAAAKGGRHERAFEA